MPATVVLISLCVVLASLRRSGPVRRRMWLALYLGLGVVGWVGWLVRQTETPAAARHKPWLPRLADGDVKEATDVQARTDAGSPIQLFTWDTTQLEPQGDDGEARFLRQFPAFSGRIIQVGPPDPFLGCHGWTFTGGRYNVDPEQVERILRENGYVEMQVPRSGDLIVYRDRETGLITHTGIVRVADGEGLVLIESKWGSNGRYLHEPGVQWYSQRFAYYRSLRRGHGLAGIGEP